MRHSGLFFVGKYIVVNLDFLQRRRGGQLWEINPREGEEVEALVCCGWIFFFGTAMISAFKNGPFTTAIQRSLQNEFSSSSI